MSLRSSIALAASLASFVLARTDLVGCTSTDVSSPAGASLAWYVPGTGEICDFLDCGGGRAPPKTTVPGCPLYSGTATYSPSYLAGYGAMTASAVASAAASTSTANVVPAISSASHSSSESWSSASDSVFDLTYTTSATETGTGAGSETTEVSSLDNGVSVVSTLSTRASGITSAPAVVGTGASTPGATGGRNGTVASATPRATSSSVISTGAAMETARVWLGSAGLLGLGAIVAAL